MRVTGGGKEGFVCFVSSPPLSYLLRLKGFCGRGSERNIRQMCPSWRREGEDFTGGGVFVLVALCGLSPARCCSQPKHMYDFPQILCYYSE